MIGTRLDRRRARTGVCWAIVTAVLVVAAAAASDIDRSPQRSPPSALAQGVVGARIYGHSNANSAIVRIDTADGRTAAVGPTGFGSGASSMATSFAPVSGPEGKTYPAGTLFGLFRDNGAGADFVVAVDTATGVASKVVRTSRGISGRGIAFGADGATLYLIESSGVLSTVDTVTGAVMRVGALVDAEGRDYSSSSLEWDPDSGSLFAFAGEDLIAVDPATAEVQVIGSISDFQACTLLRAPGSLPGPDGVDWPQGTWFTINRRGDDDRLLALDVDAAARRVEVLETFDPLGPTGRTLCGTAFVVPAPSVSRRPLLPAVPTPRRHRRYLPTVHQSDCRPRATRADVALVLDMSTSMYRTTRADRTKHAAALEAARLLIDALRLERDRFGGRDRVAVVGFNDVAWTELPLTADRAAAERALEALLARIQEGTRIDLAFREGQAALEVPRDPRVTPVMVVLTDGLPNRVPFPPGGRQEDTVLAAAQAAKDAGTTVFTVGLGRPDDIIGWMLEAAASVPANYYYAPDGEELAAIYGRIAGRIVGCP